MPVIERCPTCGGPMEPRSDVPGHVGGGVFVCPKHGPALDDEPEFEPPRIECCESAKATGGAYHRPGCPNAS